jgi:hypothetical protein
MSIEEYEGLRGSIEARPHTASFEKRCGGWCGNCGDFVPATQGTHEWDVATLRDVTAVRHHVDECLEELTERVSSLQKQINDQVEFTCERFNTQTAKHFEHSGWLKNTDERVGMLEHQCTEFATRTTERIAALERDEVLPAHD